MKDFVIPPWIISGNEPPNEEGEGLSPNIFVAARIPSEGWVVLCPWVRTPDGYWWRPHVPFDHPHPWSGEAKGKAEHYAAELNRAIAREQAKRACFQAKNGRDDGS